MILGPAMARLGSPLPKKLVKALGGGNIQRAALPTHIHRSQLLMPPPLLCGPQNAFSRRLTSPSGRIISICEDRPTLFWNSFPVSAKKSVVYLSGVSPAFPSYFTRTLDKLCLDKTYPLTAVENNCNQ